MMAFSKHVMPGWRKPVVQSGTVRLCSHFTPKLAAADPGVGGALSLAGAVMSGGGEQLVRCLDLADKVSGVR